MLISRKSTQEEGRAWAKALRSVNIQEAIVAGAKEPEKLTEQEGEGGDLGSGELETRVLSGHQERFGFNSEMGSPVKSDWQLIFYPN